MNIKKIMVVLIVYTIVSILATYLGYAIYFDDLSLAVAMAVGGLSLTVVAMIAEWNFMQSDRESMIETLFYILYICGLCLWSLPTVLLLLVIIHELELGYRNIAVFLPVILPLANVLIIVFIYCLVKKPRNLFIYRTQVLCS